MIENDLRVLSGIKDSQEEFTSKEPEDSPGKGLSPRAERCLDGRALDVTHDSYSRTYSPKQRVLEFQVLYSGVRVQFNVGFVRIKRFPSSA